MCANKTVLINTLQTLIEEGGEGIILRKPRSLYESGRSTLLLKLKASRSDQEALVMEVEQNGDLFLQTPDGIFFTVPKVDYDLPRLPLKGDIVTFSHDFQTRRSIPSNPIIYRLRNDVTWEDVLQNASLPVRQFINEPHQNMQNFTAKPRGYWSYDKGKNMREFLEGLAKRMGFDPLLPENWYSVSRQECMQYREVRTLVRYFGNSLIEALVTLFPEIGLEIPKFDYTPKNFWDNVQNRRELYERFAQAEGGDPLSPSFWYTVNAEHLRKFKGGKSAVQYYKGFVESVIHLFPELKWQPTFFSQRTVNSWANVKARRDFFDNFAARKGFDPLVPENWYSVTTRSFKDFQGYEAILNYYAGKLSECLMQLYPDIGLQKSRFNILSYWNNKENRRAALLHFAEAKGFDALVCHNWYQKSMEDFLAFPETRSMLYHYNGKYIAALIDLFPHLHLDPFNFVHVPQGYWEDHINRRKLFCQIASQRGFDPLVPSNWYTVSAASLAHVKSASYVLSKYYNGSLTNALVNLFPDIRIVQSRFRNGRTKEWMEEKNRRWYLETLAKKHNFDPLKADMWVLFLMQNSIRKDKIFLKIIANYKNTASALSSLFPELDTSLFLFDAWKTKVNVN